MTTDSNIYDIDGELLRSSEDTSELTIEEAQKRIESYQKKLNELAEKDPKDPKLSIYNTYIKNLQTYVFNQYLLHPELMPHMTNTTQDEIQKAMEDLKADVEAEEAKETKMDEYVDFEEVKDEKSESL
jgi:CRISPR/Cas system-associated endonuclease/helicase Cas3